MIVQVHDTVLLISNETLFCFFFLSLYFFVTMKRAKYCGSNSMCERMVIARRRKKLAKILYDCKFSIY
uniref:Uncharacterized protein n=1 Tax=Anguilla anguilla TaxID=7936 RepID=A0A0E9W1R4_ANGAN